MFFLFLIKNMRRNAFTNALFCLLLALAGTLVTLSTGLLYSVYQSEQNLDDVITTIAMPDLLAVRRYARNLIEKGDVSNYTTSWGDPLELYKDYYVSKDDFLSFASGHMYFHIIKQINENVYGSGKLPMDDRRVCGAYVPGLRSVPYNVTDADSAKTYVEKSAQSTVAFIVNCKSVEDVIGWWYTEELDHGVIADFIVEEEIIIHDGRNRTRTVSGYFPHMNPDGSIPVEEGKRYLIVGKYYSQTDSKPDWYYSMPDWKNPNALFMGVIGSNVEAEASYTIRTWRELDEMNEDFATLLLKKGFVGAYFPLSVVHLIPKADPKTGSFGLNWFELEGSLEDALVSRQGDQIRSALNFAEVSCNSLTVLTTNDLNSIPRFNQRTNKIIEGRPFSVAEIENGAQVCVISDLLAGINNLKVGDELPLQFFPAPMHEVATGVWTPALFDPKDKLEEPALYTIVGIYKGLTQELAENAVSPNTVIIPAKSYSGGSNTAVDLDLTGTNGPQLLRTIIVPNDKVVETKALIESLSEGSGALFRFYDQGYTTLRPVLANLRAGMTWIASISVAAWVIAVIIFSMFYINRKKREVALLYGLGVSKKNGFAWVFLQSALVIVIAQCIAVVVARLLFNDILDSAVYTVKAFSEIYRDFLLSEMNISGGIRIELPLDKTQFGVAVAVIGNSVLMLVIACALSIRAALRSSLLKRGEA